MALLAHSRVEPSYEAKRGRPSDYSPKVAEAICGLMTAGAVKGG
jgi:hypothetical protein